MKAKKSLGQHWLIDPMVTKAVIEAGPIGPDDTVLEIGPGTGVLTADLVNRAARVIGIEADIRLIPTLQKRFAREIQAGRLTIIHGDAKQLDPDQLRLTLGQWKVAANIPYYLTGILLRRLLSHRNQPRQIIVMIQNEVGKRIVAADQKESRLSISVKAFGNPRYVARVPSSAFQPRPRVDSCIVAIDNISRARFQTVDEKKFFDLLKRGFAHKRKKLINNLEVDAEQFKPCDLNPQIRAEAIHLEQWLCLAKIV